jgi:hypothetical protein
MGMERNKPVANIQKMKDSCPNIKANLEACTCTYDACDKTGLCCQCVAYHRRMRQIPGCFFTSEGERTYDRSYAKFCSDCC